MIAEEHDTASNSGGRERMHAAGGKIKTNHLHTVPGAEHLTGFSDAEEYKKILDLITALCQS